MPYIVQNNLGIGFNNNLYLGPNTMNFGTQSDVASASNVNFYLVNSQISIGTMSSDNFYINRGLVRSTDIINVAVLNNFTSDSSTYVIIGSYSSGASGSNIWLGTSSRSEGNEIVIRRIDASTASVTIISSQTDISINSGLGWSLANSITLPSNGFFRFIRVDGAWRRTS